MTPVELAALMAGAAPHAVLDLRERGAYERGHVYRATSLPRRLLEFRLELLVPSRATPVAVYDEDGTLAARARPTFAAMGYRGVSVLDGGISAWRAAGRRVVQGINVPSKVFGERVLREAKTPEIPPHELKARIDRGDDMVIVDSRTPEEYTRGCIPGATSMPGGELVLRIGELVARPETTIVVHCGGRTRSYLGTESLRRMGLPNPIVALQNGTMGWELAGLALERGAKRWVPPVSARSRAAAMLVAKRVAAEDGVRFVSSEDLRALLAAEKDRNVYVLDVRTAEEYTAGHVAGAVWAPGGQVVQATDEYVAVRGASIVLVCDGLTRSVMAAAWLMRMGFPDVAVLGGGLPAWEQSEGAIERGRPAPPPFGPAAALARVSPVPPAALQAELGSVVVLDVDQSDAYARGHVPGAGWVCRSRLEARIPSIAPDRARRIVVTCADGFASTLAAATLRDLGYDARPLEGGTRAWGAAGLSLELGATRPLDEADDVTPKPYERGREAMEAYLRWEEDLDGEGQSGHALLPPAR